MSPILVSAPARLALGVAATLLAACGQKGPLYLPQTPDAAHRASLPASVFGSITAPATPAAAKADAPQADASAPANPSAP